MASVGARIKGMGFGCIFMALFAGFWIGTALVDASAFDAIAGVVLPTLFLLVPAVVLIRTGSRRMAAEPPPSAEGRAAAARMGRAFGLIFAAEFGAIAIAANLLAHWRHAELIPPVVGLLVGIHFLPLARVFEYRLYFKTGIASIVACLGTLWLAGHRADAAAMLTGLLMAVILWITCLVVLSDGRRMARG